MTIFRMITADGKINLKKNETTDKIRELFEIRNLKI